MYKYLLLSTLFLTSCNKLIVPGSRLGSVKKLAPTSWSSTREAQAGVDRAWVKRFNDRKLTRLVNEAVSNNPDMKVAGERVRQSLQNARMAGASSRLSSDISTSGNRRKTVFIGFPFGGSQTSNTYGINWMVNWEPDIWGRVRAGVSAAVAEAQAVELERRAAESSLAAQVCKAYFNLCETNEQLTLSNQAYALRKKTVETIRDRFENAILGLQQNAGSGASELRLAETDLATSLAVKAQREGAVDAAKRQLELLLGRYPAGLVTGKIKLPPIPSRPPAGLPSGLLLRRPDILAAERRFASAGMSIKEAKLALFPQFKLTASTGSTTDELGKILSSKFGVWSLGTNITQTILTGGRAKGEISNRHSRHRQALANLHSKVLTAFGEVEQTLSADHWLAKRIFQLKKALKLAQDAESASIQDYAEGNIDALTMLTAQTRRIDIESNLVVLRRMQLENRVNLHLALGGEFRSIKK